MVKSPKEDAFVKAGKPEPPMSSASDHGTGKGALSSGYGSSKSLNSSSSHSDQRSRASWAPNSSGTYAKSGHSGYGRPDEYLSPTTGRKRASWRPKESPQSPSTTPLHEKPKLLNIPTSPTFSEASEKYIQAVSPTQVEQERTSGTKHSRRVSAPPSLTQIEATPTRKDKRASVVQRWKNMSEEVPPAFKIISTPRGSKQTIKIPAKTVTSPVVSPVPEPVNHNQISPSMTKARLNPSKLKTQWPPVPKNYVVQREVAQVTKGSVKSKRSSFETSGWPKDHPRGSPRAYPRQTSPRPTHESQKLPELTLPEAPLILADDDDDDEINASDAEEQEQAQQQKPFSKKFLGYKEPKRVIHKRTSMRIRWGGNSVHVFLKDYFEPEVLESMDMSEPLINDRFASRSKDARPMRPQRQPSEIRWLEDSDDDEDYNSSDYEFSSSDEEGETSETQSSPKVKNYNRPDVWITPMDEYDSENCTDNEALWRVRRVWNCEPIDEHEEEVNVSNDDLMDTVKSLLGVGKDSFMAGDKWKVKKIVDIDGVIDHSEKQQKIDEASLLEGIKIVAAEDAASREELDVEGANEKKALAVEDDEKEEGADEKEATVRDSIKLTSEDKTTVAEPDTKEEKDVVKDEENESKVRDLIESSMEGKTTVAKPGKPSSDSKNQMASIHSTERPLFAYDRSPRVREAKKKVAQKGSARSSLASLLSPPPIIQFHDWPDSD